MQIEFSKQLPVKYDVDILVAGGGPAGMAAAVTAARKGARVFLAEAHTCFGGMGTAGLIPLFMNFCDGNNFLAGGFGKEIHDAVLEAGGIKYNRYLSIPSEKLKRIYDNLAIQSQADFTFQTTIADVVVENDKIKYAICNSKSGLFAIKAKTFIDCTGDGDLSALAGSDFEKGNEDGKTMPATLCSLWANADWNQIDPTDTKKMMSYLEKAFKDNIFTVKDRHHSGMARTGWSLASGNIGHIYDIDATDERSITRGLLEGRAYLPEYEKFYRNYVPGYQNAELVTSGSLLGVRESRRIIGDYILNAADYLNRQKFEDQIGCYSYEVDIHPSSASKEDYKKSIQALETTKYQDGEHYGIPYRSLTVKGFDNLLVAGRCVSTDQTMQSSIRTMPGCFITGQAAGMAAAIASNANITIRDIEINSLQASLKEIGAFLGLH